MTTAATTTAAGTAANTIVVGDDGSAIAARALRWATARARSRGQSVRVVTAVDDAARVLVRESTTCDLLVLGTRGHFRRVDTLLGSTSRSVATNSWCPTALVGPAAAATAPRRLVVVGGPELDAAHLAALSWVVDEARTGQLPIHLLTPWRRGLPTPWDLAVDHGASARAASARRNHLATMRQLAVYAGDGLVVTGDLAEGDLGPVLDEHTERDDLVVLARPAGHVLMAALEQARSVVVVVPPQPLRTAWSTARVQPQAQVHPQAQRRFEPAVSPS